MNRTGNRYRVRKGSRHHIGLDFVIKEGDEIEVVSDFGFTVVIKDVNDPDKKWEWMSAVHLSGFDKVGNE